MPSYPLRAQNVCTFPICQYMRIHNIVTSQKSKWFLVITIICWFLMIFTDFCHFYLFSKKCQKMAKSGLFLTPTTEWILLIFANFCNFHKFWSIWSFLVISGYCWPIFWPIFWPILMIFLKNLVIFWPFFDQFCHFLTLNRSAWEEGS